MVKHGLGGKRSTTTPLGVKSSFGEKSFNGGGCHLWPQQLERSSTGITLVTQHRPNVSSFVALQREADQAITQQAGSSSKWSNSKRRNNTGRMQ